MGGSALSLYNCRASHTESVFAERINRNASLRCDWRMREWGWSISSTICLTMVRLESAAQASLSLSFQTQERFLLLHVRFCLSSLYSCFSPRSTLRCLPSCPSSYYVLSVFLAPGNFSPGSSRNRRDRLPRESVRFGCCCRKGFACSIPGTLSFTHLSPVTPLLLPLLTSLDETKARP